MLVVLAGSLFRAKEAEQMQQAADHGINRNNNDPRPLIAAERFRSRIHCGLDAHCADDSAKHNKHAQNAALDRVGGQVGGHGIIRNIESGEADGVAEIIGYGDVDILDDFAGVRRNGHHQNAADGKGYTHAQHPDSGAPMLGVSAVNDHAHEDVGDTVKQPGNQHDGADDAGVQTKHVGIIEENEGSDNRVDKRRPGITKHIDRAFYHTEACVGIIGFGKQLHDYSPIFLRKITDGVMKRGPRRLSRYYFSSYRVSFQLSCICRLSAYYRTRGCEWWGRNSGATA